MSPRTRHQFMLRCGVCHSALSDSVLSNSESSRPLLPMNLSSEPFPLMLNLSMQGLYQLKHRTASPVFLGHLFGSGPLVLGDNFRDEQPLRVYPELVADPGPLAFLFFLNASLGHVNILRIHLDADEVSVLVDAGDTSAAGAHRIVEHPVAGA